MCVCIYLIGPGPGSLCFYLIHLRLNLELRRLKKKLKAREQAHMETRALAKKQSKDRPPVAQCAIWILRVRLSALRYPFPQRKILIASAGSARKSCALAQHAAEDVPDRSFVVVQTCNWVQAIPSDTRVPTCANITNLLRCVFSCCHEFLPY